MAAALGAVEQREMHLDLRAFGGSALTAIALPVASGSGIPAIGDWVTCSISGFSNGFDPHTVTAYQSPSSSDARLTPSGVPLTFTPQASSSVG